MAVVALVAMVTDSVVAGGRCHHGYCGGGGGIGGGWWWLSSPASWQRLSLLGAVVAESAEGRWWLQYVENG